MYDDDPWAGKRKPFFIGLGVALLIIAIVAVFSVQAAIVLGGVMVIIMIVLRLLGVLPGGPGGPAGGGP